MTQGDTNTVNYTVSVIVIVLGHFTEPCFQDGMENLFHDNHPYFLASPI